MISGICCIRMVFPHEPRGLGVKFWSNFMINISSLLVTLAMWVRKLLANVNFFRQSLHWCCLSLEWVVWWIFKPVGVANFFEHILQMHSSPAIRTDFVCYHFAWTTTKRFYSLFTMWSFSCVFICFLRQYFWVNFFKQISPERKI